MIDIQVYVAEAAVGVPTPDELVSGINLKRVGALTPSCQLDANIVDCRAAFEVERYPARRKYTIVSPFRELVVVKTVGGAFIIDRCRGAFTFTSTFESI